MIKSVIYVTIKTYQGGSMIEEFLSKLNNNEYISNYLYEYVLNNNSSVIPTGFNIDEYNGKILDKLYVDNKDYFDNMYKGIDDNIHLDEEQCKAILADEKYSLIIAGAGTGKTTTMVSKGLLRRKKAQQDEGHGRIYYTTIGRKGHIKNKEIKFGGNKIAAPYTFLGLADYVKSEGSKPMNVVWKLRKPIPAKYLKKTNQLTVG